MNCNCVNRFVPIGAIDVDGNIIYQFESITEGCRFFNLAGTTIRKLMRTGGLINFRGCKMTLRRIRK